MEHWHVLAVIGVALVILEIFTPSFFMLPAGLAFFVTAAVSPFLPGLTATVGVLACTLLVVYGVFYRFVWPRMAQTSAPRTNASGMVGQIAVVTEAIDAEGNAGYVKLYGDTWRALAHEPFAVGERVVIVQTQGNKVIVGRVPSL